MHKIIILSGNLNDQRNRNIIVNRKVYSVNYNHILKYTFSTLMCNVTIYIIGVGELMNLEETCIRVSLCMTLIFKNLN